MMRTRGLYKTGYISSIDSFAVEIPYENDRYSLLIVMPKAHNGVKSLIKQFTMNTLHKIDSEMKEEHLHLTIPKFKVETTGRAEKALAKVRVFYFCLILSVSFKKVIVNLFKNNNLIYSVASLHYLHVRQT